MTKKTKNILRVVSILLAVLTILMRIGIIPSIVYPEYHFWVMVIAYFLLVLSMRN